ncbi:MAG: WbqC family protein [Bacteroidetes bacterium]|nr:WbqC family protein [Bacteroidota bacterium]
MKVVILQSNYIPWKGYFDLIHDADVFVFYDEVQYTKNDWRNRNKIYTKNGLQWLTIPISAEATKQKISEVKLNSNWQKLHFKTLQNGYQSAPFYFQLEELMEDYLVKNNWQTLSELNQYLITRISSKIGIHTQFKNSVDFNLEGNRVERLLSLLQRLGANEYITGPGASIYLADYSTLFSSNNILLTFKKYPDYKPYKQFEQPFASPVSILDLIAHVSYDKINEHIWES